MTIVRGLIEMEDFNKISIQEMSKKDMFTIIKALELAAESTNDYEYIDLKEDILSQLCDLAGCSQEEFLALLQS